jgi:hypothetical protein
MRSFPELLPLSDVAADAPGFLSTPDPDPEPTCHGGILALGILDRRSEDWILNIPDYNMAQVIQTRKELRKVR